MFALTNICKTITFQENYVFDCSYILYIYVMWKNIHINTSIDSNITTIKLIITGMPYMPIGTTIYHCSNSKATAAATAI